MLQEIFRRKSIALSYNYIFLFYREDQIITNVYLILKQGMPLHIDPLSFLPLFAYFHETLLFSDDKVNSMSPYSLQGRILPLAYEFTGTWYTSPNAILTTALLIDCCYLHFREEQPEAWGG